MSINAAEFDFERLKVAAQTATRSLLAERVPAGHWVGELSTSALSTATAVSALAIVARAGPKAGTEAGPDHERVLPGLVERGVQWLVRHQNPDGGWGDTPASYSNISTTLLAMAAIRLAEVGSPNTGSPKTGSSGRGPLDRGQTVAGQTVAGQTVAGQTVAGNRHADALSKAGRFVEAAGGWDALRQRYGRDKTFAVPILTNCALAGMVDWREVSPLPFELACFPQGMYRMLQLPVVSYAIPALVAIGQARYFHRPPWNPVTGWIRSRLVEPSLRILQRMQPASGGYLEAVPLTSFVVMSLAATGRAGHAVTQLGVQFLIDSVRHDGSWPIDTNLATWNTTLALNALSAGGAELSEQSCLDWLLACQTKHIHPFTGAEPGGWGWTNLSGSVPDADDTPSALLALATWSRSPRCTGPDRRRIRDAALFGVKWLLGLQNRNGGWPTFCRGWGKLPFDRSGADLTAHVVRALHTWSDLIDCRREIQRGLRFLAETQHRNGCWIPLWFGNQDSDREENPVYGTAKVLLAYRDLGELSLAPAQRGLAWLRGAQNPDGGWGGGPSPAGGSVQEVGSSVEETALAVDTLIAAGEWPARGLNWLMEAVETGRYRQPSPIGFYFAKLWYHEKLYPIIFTASALGRAARQTSCADHTPAKPHRSLPSDPQTDPQIKQPCP